MEKDMEVNVVIGWVKRGKSGTFTDKKTGEPRPWQIWTFKIEDDERYFTWFEKADTPNPEVGKKIKAMEFEIEQKGEYTNHTVKFLKYEAVSSLPSGSTQKPKQDATGRPGGTVLDKDISFYVSYAKDLMVALIPMNQDYGQGNIEDLADIVTSVGKRMLRAVSGKAEPNTDPVGIPRQGTVDTLPDGREFPPPDDDIPF